mgnify:CR=1 FL=1
MPELRIQLLSDLHLEAHPHWRPQPAPGSDVLVLAGDIGSYQRDREGKVKMAEPDWGLGRFAGWPVPVLFVPGNHEYDALDWDEAHAGLREACARHGLVWLERATHVLHGVRFIGTTLWADYDALADVPERRKGKIRPITDALQHRARQRERAFRAANHHLAQAATQRHGALFDAAAMREQALVCQRWLAAALAESFDGPTVVVTHFAPSLRSADPRYGVQPSTAGFCNALDDLLDQADLWLHGHVHCRHDYRAGRCRVVAHPLGYADKGEQAGYDPLAVVTLAWPD